ncbi:IS200/IS605 family transposase [Nitrosococcus wardiae]|uniref:IS200/IS605 family transposase n=1 Tax=Nitrosococcus wardiae TaxID=1814290 RepID=A0A4P7BV97_9GAMM|nr:IS200/IS605 family transposase [Nitrosococcus wardiae]QBQ53923.1 IS200/IS605 family transposase [Nitrosococcus wardiae]
MSRFRKLSHTIWHCQYHIVWVPKYRHRILTGRVAEEVGWCIRAFAEQQKGEVVELNVQFDHVHWLVWVPPKVSLSDFVGTVKGRTAIRVFNKFRELKRRLYWGHRFWARGYCVDTVGLDEAKIRAYVQYQERRERRAEQQGLDV